MKINKLELKWLGHSGFFICNGKNIYIDPYMISDNCEKADIILITHSHYDHCSIADLRKITKDGTTIVVSADAQSKIGNLNHRIDMHVVELGEEIDFRDLKVLAVPAYNLTKMFHPKDEHWFGYVLKFDDVVIYHAGDTDLIPEMQKLTGFGSGKEFIALLPVGGKYVMDAEEACEAAVLIKPSVAIPIHYGSVAGTIEDALEFKKLCEERGVNVEVLEKE
ncbi:MAG: MBL fold metallo-hydrolase [Nanoarchaeota archaeon]